MNPMMLYALKLLPYFRPFVLLFILTLLEVYLLLPVFPSIVNRSFVEAS